ncbi:cytidyltransferase-related domain protein [Methanocaldococcus vulcanius M7]|uniref:Cytidyltransferase-related domain protein n=1 Tax=Methanocaldococcus vulcanius (strain ATCC 700851 / DSM 12094 / M7) TaxID=579137 RepID=C9RIF1_METVM|nr:nucleotidyltransferase family protein [Methanocaldococcus vulcanius]ACX73353.1 cytidyltransferase-related domain protein [Methanocaldococcus vulcanius M7]
MVIGEIMSIDLIYSNQLKNFLKDREEIITDSKRKDKRSFKNFKKIVEEIKNREGKDKIVCDFTEYNPLHKGHKYALEKGKKYGIFISVLPAPLERSGRGVPYFLNRHIRAEMAIKAGADIVVEGPPMGIMGSGQYMRCLIKMFYTLGAEIIPRGYIPEETMEKIINCINKGYHIRIKPYKIICIETGEILGEKLNIDNYVIASMSQMIYKLNREGLKFNPKFVFVKRLEGISGTKIREAIFKGKFEEIKDMLPETTLEILKELYKSGKLNDLILRRFEDRILETANEFDLYRYLPSNVAEILERKRPFNSIEEIKNSLPYGFSRHFKERLLSKLEAQIPNEILSKYINNYPAKIKILAVKL